MKYHILLLLSIILSASALPNSENAGSQFAFKGICPDLDVRCVKDGDWRNPIGKLGAKPFCRQGIRCNQCEESNNTRECNRTFKECEGECEAYGPIPF